MVARESCQVSQPRWGAKGREVKAQAILQTLRHFSSMDFAKTIWLDIGCGNGEIAATIAPHVKNIIAVDREPWSCWKIFVDHHDNLNFIDGHVEKLPLKSESVDFVICNQVYEHVNSQVLLFGEMCRVVKPGGYGYFAGPNLLFPIEPHIFWPFVHWLPRNVSLKIMSFLGFKGVFDAYSSTYWKLKKQLNDFDVENAIPYIIKNPEYYSRFGFLWKIISKIPCCLLSFFSFLSPGLIFVLKKDTCQKDVNENSLKNYFLIEED